MATKKVTVKAPIIEDEQLNDYEMVMIISPEITGEELDTTVANISQSITSRGGEVASVERWGKRKLAYPIEHFSEGHYMLARFKMTPSLNRELEANLQISEAVLRHLLIRVE